MLFKYNVKSIKLDEETNQSTVVVAVSAEDGDREQMTGTFLGGVPMKTVVNWLKSCVEPSDTVEITFAKNVKGTAPEPVEEEEAESVEEKPITSKKKAK